MLFAGGAAEGLAGAAEGLAGAAEGLAGAAEGLAGDDGLADGLALDLSATTGALLGRGLAPRLCVRGGGGRAGMGAGRAGMAATMGAAAPPGGGGGGWDPLVTATACVDGC